MSLDLGFGSVIERYQRARDAVIERYQQDRPENSVYLASEMLTNEEMLARSLMTVSFHHLHLYQCHRLPA